MAATKAGLSLFFPVVLCPIEVSRHITLMTPSLCYCLISKDMVE